MSVSRRSRLLLCAATWLFPLVRLAPLLRADERAAAEAAPIRVQLRPAASSQGQVVRLGDVAVIDGADRELRARLRQLDVSDPLDIGEESRLTRSQVSIRLLLAGLQQDDFRLSGAPTVVITHAPRSPLDDQWILTSVQSAVAQKLQLPAEDIQLTLLRPLNLSQRLDSPAAADTRLETRLPNNLWAKSLTSHVGIHAQGRLQHVVTVVTQLRIRADVPTALEDIEAGELLSAANVSVQRRYLAAPAVRRLAENPIGQRAGRDLRAGDAIQQSHLTSSEFARRDVLVRPREPVEVIARRGALVIKMKRAIALDVGRLGDVIRVRNTDTDRIVQGRVTRRWTVEISF